MVRRLNQVRYLQPTATDNNNGMKALSSQSFGHAVAISTSYVYSIITRQGCLQILMNINSCQLVMYVSKCVDIYVAT